ncbi:amidase family protein [Cupriavidus sp. WS]|uniref:amidase family protein n=1 Tax=Cupriavidus sp. WS TaxID=1312922 RepID=UPI00036B58A5|nr:amidase family protein [Cupriavidus sp. WS]
MIHQASFQRLRALYRDRALTPVDVVRSALEHAERVDPVLNAFALIDRQPALVAASQSARRWRHDTPLGPLDGMPITVKESASVRGWPSRRGSATTADTPAPDTTVCVRRLLASGAILLGQTRAPEFNWKGVTDSPAFGITRNPWNTALTPGGSSGGCAAAVAAGVVRISLGSDAGGSVRIPATFCGVIGLKPNHGRIPLAPFPSAFSHLVHAGLLGTHARDIAETLQVVSGPSPADWTSNLGQALRISAAGTPPGKLRIGLLAPRRWAESEPAVHAAMHGMLVLLADGGACIEEVDYDIHAASRTAAELYRLGCAAAVAGVPPARRAKLDPGLVAFAGAARCGSMPEYHALCRQRDAHAGALEALFERVDMLLLPTVPIRAFRAGMDQPEHWPGADWMSWNPYTPAFNGAQVPAMSYPLWTSASDDLPAGIQFVAPRYQEGRLLALAMWLESVLPLRLAPFAA